MVCKYVRIKEGVYENEGFWGASICLKGHRSVPLDQMVRQANTIEELCDEFVAYHKTLKLTYCIQKTPFKENNENFNIYGAIWTDKGLIYVAKLNSKGELELL